MPDLSDPVSTPAPSARKVTLVRGNGTRLDATPEQAERLKLLGYTEESPEQQEARLVEQAKQEYYTEPAQVARTAIEGLGAGATFGATDFLLGDEETQLRARYNPGTRLGTEVAGAIAPLVLSGGAGAGAGLAKLAPTVKAARAAEALAVGKAGSLTRAVTRGAIEGGIYGAAGAADHAWLDGDPVTAEAVLHGFGWGTVLGGGLSALGHGVSALGAHEGKVLAAEKRAAEAPQLAENARVAARNQAEAARYVDELVTGEAQAGTRTAAEKARFASESAAAQATAEARNAAKLAEYEAAVAKAPKYVEPGALHKTAGLEYDAFRAEVANVTRVTRETITAADEAATAAFRGIRSSQEFRDIVKLAGRAESDIAREVTQAERLYRKATQAAERGKFELAMDHASKFDAAMKGISEVMATPVVGNPAGALKEMIGLRALAPEAAKFPRTVSEFALMSPVKAERMLASLDQLAKVETPGVAALKTAQENFLKALGADSQTGMRGAWRAAKATHTAEGKAVAEVPLPVFEEAAGVRPPKVYTAKEPRAPRISEPREVRPGRAPAEESHGAGLLQRVLGYAVGGKAYVAASALGLGKVGSYAAYRGARDAVTSGGHHLIGLRAGFVGGLRKAASEYLPQAGRAIRAARIPAALGFTLTGEPDTSSRDTQVLAANRVREIHQLAPNIRDTMFRAVEPLAVSQPKLAPAVHAAGVAAFQELLAVAPKDPGVVSGLKSIWRPSLLQAWTFGKQLSVFQNPAGEARFMLETGEFDPVKVEALRKFAPATWQELRVGLLERISQPEVAAKLTYRDQIGLSAMLDLALHTSMTPEHIAAAQEAHTVRSNPAPANPRMGQDGGLPDPQTSPNATSAQRSTAR